MTSKSVNRSRRPAAYEPKRINDCASGIVPSSPSRPCAPSVLYGDCTHHAPHCPVGLGTESAWGFLKRAVFSAGNAIPAKLPGHNPLQGQTHSAAQSLTAQGEWLPNTHLTDVSIKADATYLELFQCADQISRQHSPIIMLSHKSATALSHCATFCLRQAS